MLRLRLVLFLLVGCLLSKRLALTAIERTGQTPQDLKTESYREVREALNGAVTINPKIVAYSDFSEAYSKPDRTEPAIAAFQKPFSKASANPPALFSFKACYLARAKFGKVAESYREQFPSSSDNPKANEDHTLALIKAGKFKEAIEDLRTLKKTRPSDISIRVALINAYFRAGMKSDGERETQEVLDSSPLSATEGLILAKVLIENKQPQPAQGVLEKLAIAWPDSAEVHAELGLLLSAKSQFEQAAWELGRAVQLEPDSVRYTFALAEVLLFWRHYATAFDFVTAVEQRFGRLPDLEYYLAYSLYGLRRYDQAIAKLDRLLGQHPQFDRAYHLSGNCYVNLGNSQKAAASFKKAIQLNPRNPSYYVSLAEVMRRNTRTIDEAIAYAKEAVQLDPTSSEGKFQLALCYESKKDYARAQVLLEEVVQAHPELIPPHRVLARIYYQQGKISEADRQTKITATLEAQQVKVPPGSAAPAQLPKP